MRRLPCLALSFFAALGTAGSVAAQKVTKVVVSGYAESIEQLTLFFGTYSTPCGTYFAAGDDFCCASVGVLVFGGESADLVTRSLRNGPFTHTPGITVAAEDGVLTITSPLDITMALWSTFEADACGGDVRSLLRLDGCTINNVSNGVVCDENEPYELGLSFVGGNTTYLAELSGDPALQDTGGDPNLGPRTADPAEPFNVSIDCTRATRPGLYVLALSLSPVGAPRETRWGQLFFSGLPAAWALGFHMRSVESWSSPPGTTLPDDPSLAGLSYTVQGLCTGYPGLARLSEALVQTIR